MTARADHPFERSSAPSVSPIRKRHAQSVSMGAMSGTRHAFQRVGGGAYSGRHARAYVIKDEARSCLVDSSHGILRKRLGLHCRRDELALIQMPSRDMPSPAD